MKKIILILILIILITSCAPKIKEGSESPSTTVSKGIIQEVSEEEKIEEPKLPEKEIPSSYLIENVPLYQENNFCYGASAMMTARYWGLSEEETQKLRQLMISGEGLMGPPRAPPIIIPALSKFNLGSFVYLGYLKGSDLNPLRMWTHALDEPNKQVKTFNSPDEALLYLKRLISNKIPVIAIVEWDLTKKEGEGEEGAKDDHFTVVVGYDENNIYTNDPSPDRGRGVYSYTIADFLKRWDLRGTTSRQAAFLGDYGMIWLEKNQKEQKIEQSENLVEGKTLNERLNILKAHLHTEGSGDEAKKYFPDFVEVYVDEDNPRFPSMVLPFTYYYSEEADITVSICNISYTVFICDGKLHRLISESDYSKCKIADEYLHPEMYS